MLNMGVFLTQGFHEVIKIFARLEFVLFSENGWKHFERIEHDTLPTKVKARLNTTGVIIASYIVYNGGTRFSIIEIPICKLWSLNFSAIIYDIYSASRVHILKTKYETGYHNLICSFVRIKLHRLRDICFQCTLYAYR